MKHLFILCAGLTLAACQTTKVEPPVSRMVCPAPLTQEQVPQPKVPDEADLELVDTPEARASAGFYLAYVEKLALWGRDGWAIAATAKNYCEDKK